MRGKNMNRKVLSILLAFLLISSPVMAGFIDMPNNWATDALKHSIDNNILKGDEKGYLRPDCHITRAELATIISRFLNLSDRADLSKFTDVSKANWYYDDLSKLVAAGIIKGNEKNQLNPNIKITREEAFLMFSRLLSLENRSNNIKTFSDWEKVSSWSLDGVNNLISEGYIHGNNKNQLKPKDFISRAEIAKIISNIGPNINLSENETYHGNLIINTPIKEINNIKVDGDLILADGVKVDKLVLKNVTVEGRVLVRNSSLLELESNTYVEELIVLKDSLINVKESSQISQVTSYKKINLVGDRETVKKVHLKKGADNSQISIINIYFEKDDEVENVKDRDGNIINDSKLIINKEESETPTDPEEIPADPEESPEAPIIPLPTDPEKPIIKEIELKKLNPIIVESQIPGVSPMFSVEKEELKKHFKNVNEDSIFNIKIEDKDFTLKYNSRSEVFQIYEDEDLEDYSLVGYDKDILLDAIVSILD